MIYFDEHNRLHIVDENGWWTPSMLPNLLSELYSALAAGEEDGLSLHETAMFLQLLLPTEQQMTNMFGARRTANETSNPNGHEQATTKETDQAEDR